MTEESLDFRILPKISKDYVVFSRTKRQLYCIAFAFHIFCVISMETDPLLAVV